MRAIPIAVITSVLAIGAAVAQTGTPAPNAQAGAPATAATGTATTPLPPASTTPVPAPRAQTSTATATAPLKGANSFTEGEARNRLESNGYGQVSGLAKDADGIWRGTGEHDGQRVNVWLDFKGNIGQQ
jgi:periplasmic protein CpxP/Spy